MSHDKVVYFVDTKLKGISEELREELLSLHYQSLHNAKLAGLRIGAEKPIPHSQTLPNEIIHNLSLPALLFAGSAIAGAVLFVVWVFTLGV